MAISFLNPWLWLGAAAIAAPIWLHLRRKHERNLVRFSALRFLQDQREARRSPLRLTHLVLFALRGLALLLLVSAFSWPYLKGPETLPIKESRVYILDNTLSHQASGGFLKDRDRLLKEVDEAGPNIQVAVVELISSPHVLVSFGDDRETARQKLQRLRPSFQRGSYLAAFRLANSLLGNSLGHEKRIVLYADNQENQWKEEVSTPPFLRGVKVDLPKPAAPFLSDLSLSDARVQRIFLGEKSLVNFTVKLSHIGPAKQAKIILEADGQTILNRPIELTNQPETILLQAQWEAEPGKWLRGQVVVEGAPDTLAGDNRVYFSLPPLTEGKVALLAQSPYLRVALSPEVMRGEWSTRVLDPARLSGQADTTGDADVLCIESNYLQSNEARRLLWHYAQSGRGVLLFVNRLTPTVKGYLRELGFDAENAGSGETKFQFVFSNHPIFHPFLSPEYGNLMDIRVSRYVRLNSSEAVPLVFSDQGTALFFQSTKFPGKLFVCAFGMDRDQTSWPIHQSFIPFLDLALQAARADDPAPSAFEPGEVVTIQLPAGATPHELVLRSGQNQVSRSVVEQGKAQLHVPDEPGLYSVAYDNSDQISKLLAVNPPAKESELTYSRPDDVVKLWTVPALAAAPQGFSEPRNMSISAILQQRLWWWMLVAAVLVLGTEHVLAQVTKARA